MLLEKSLWPRASFQTVSVVLLGLFPSPMYTLYFSQLYTGRSTVSRGEKKFKRRYWRLGVPSLPCLKWFISCNMENSKQISRKRGKKVFSMRVATHWNRCPENPYGLHPLKYSNSTGHTLEQPDQVGSAVSTWLELYDLHLVSAKLNYSTIKKKFHYYKHHCA